MEIEIGGQWSMPTAWIERRGMRTDLYAEHGGGHAPTLGQATVRLQKGSQHDIRHTYRTTRGLAADSTLAPLPLDSVYAAYDGPRSDVGDTTRFRLDRYGAPELVVDALGRSTRIERTDTRFPSLVTGVRAPAGLRTTASYTWRGLVDTVRVIDPLGGSSGDAVTTYQWDTKWPQPTLVTGPDGVESRAWYSAETGNTDSTWVGSASRTVRFGYHTSGVEEGLPASVTVPLAAGPETYDYDWLGNLSETKSPIGFISLAFGDSIGRTVLTVSPVDSLTSLTVDSLLVTGSETHLTYDRLNRVTESIQVGRGLKVNKAASSSEPVLLAHTDSVGVSTTYDPMGNPTLVSRWYVPPGGSTKTSLHTTTAFDRAGRATSQYEDGGSESSEYVYDPAGNLVGSRDGNSNWVHSEYDVLNRKVRQLIPGTDAGWTESCTWFTSCTFSFPTLEGLTGVCTRADTLSYAYDLAGNMTRADSYAARIGRSYNRAGMITGDTLHTRAYYNYALDQPCDSPSPGGAAPSSKTYVLQYTYDVSGRRTSLKLPLDITGSGAQQYRYSPTTGELTGITAPSGDTIHFTYDVQGRLTSTLFPGAVEDLLYYDGDSRLRARKTGTALGTDHFSRDAAGRIRTVSVGEGESESYTAESWYGPMGAVVAANSITWNPGADVTGGIEEFETDALGNRTWQRQRNLYPNGPDRNGIREMSYSQGRLTGVSAAASQPGFPNFGFEQQIDHDAAGNTTISHTQRSEGTGGTEQLFLSSRSYYDPLGRLVVVNTHDGIHSATGPGGVWEEYRYDALGRRVLVRSRRLAGSTPQPGGAGTPWSYTERTVWDGDRIVAELRGDGSVGATLTEVESIGTGGIVQNGDAPWGRVQYIHALGSAAAGGIDMPVQIERDAIESGNVIRFTPLTNWRGQVQVAATAPGSGNVPLVWPDARLTLDGLPAETDPNYFWMGSLTNSMTDGSGLQYRRNRYYDPETGRFTQSDPIGLAGGMNLYGFAGSDPINFSDPFGLCPPIEECIAALQNGTDAISSGWNKYSEWKRGNREWMAENAPAIEAFGSFLETALELPGAGPGIGAVRIPTSPKLPRSVIASQGEVQVIHRYRGGDHGPAHAHVQGGGPTTRIGPRGYPLRGDPPLTSTQQSVVQRHASEIRKAINRIGRWLAHQEK